MLENAVILAMAVGGFAICVHIFNTHKKGKVLVCPIGHNCDAIISSEYSLIFGVVRTWELGMVYYGGLAIFYAIAIAMPYQSVVLAVGPLVDIATAGAALFSWYLTGIQAFVLKQWCTWCLFSAALSTGIFLLRFVF